MPTVSARISLPRNITNAHSLDELKVQLGEFVSKLEDYLNTQVGIHFLDKLTRRPTLLPGDLVFDFTNHPEFATLQQWDGQKLIPLHFSGITGALPQVCNEIPSGAIDGVNKIFTTLQDFTAQTTRLFRNGMRQTIGAGNDYTETLPKTVTFTDAPQPDDSIFIDYNTQ